MAWVLAILLVLLIGAVAVVASGHGEGLAPSDPDSPGLRLPEGEIGGGDLRRVRFGIALRGYRADEVDALLDRLADQLDGGDPSGQRRRPPKREQPLGRE